MSVSGSPFNFEQNDYFIKKDGNDFSFVQQRKTENTQDKVKRIREGLNAVHNFMRENKTLDPNKIKQLTEYTTECRNLFQKALASEGTPLDVRRDVLNTDATLQVIIKNIGKIKPTPSQQSFGERTVAFLRGGASILTNLFDSCLGRKRAVEGQQRQIKEEPPAAAQAPRMPLASAQPRPPPIPARSLPPEPSPVPTPAPQAAPMEVEGAPPQIQLPREAPEAPPQPSLPAAPSPAVAPEAATLPVAEKKRVFTKGKRLISKKLQLSPSPATPAAQPAPPLPTFAMPPPPPTPAAQAAPSPLPPPLPIPKPMDMEAETPSITPTPEPPPPSPHPSAAAIPSPPSPRLPPVPEAPATPVKLVLPRFNLQGPSTPTPTPTPVPPSSPTERELPRFETPSTPSTPSQTPRSSLFAPSTPMPSFAEDERPSSPITPRSPSPMEFEEERETVATPSDKTKKLKIDIASEPEMVSQVASLPPTPTPLPPSPRIAAIPVPTTPRATAETAHFEGTLRNVTIPLSDANQRLIATKMLTTIERGGPACGELLAEWKRSFQNADALFFSLYCNALQQVNDTSKVFAALTEIQKLAQGTLQNKELDKLLQDICKMPELKTSALVQKFCLQLINSFPFTTLDKVDANDIREHIGRFLFIGDQRPALLREALQNPQNLLVYLEEKTKEILKDIAATYHPQKTPAFKLFKSGEDRTGLKSGTINENIYAMKMAEVLLRPDGMINQGIINDMKKYLIDTTPTASEIDLHLLHVMNDFQTNKALQQDLEAIAPPTSAVGKQIVQASCSLTSAVPIRTVDARKTVLATFFGRVRQGALAACVTYAAYNSKISNTPRSMLRDFDSIFRDGLIKSKINGQEYSYPAIFKSLPYFLDREMLKGTPKKMTEAFTQIPSLQHAFTILGANTTAIETAIQSLQREGKALTLRIILQKIKELSPTPIADADLEMALTTAASAWEMPLARTENNAMSAAFWPPFTVAPGKQITSYSGFKINIMQTLSTLIKNQKIAAALASQLPETLRGCDIQGKDFNQILKHYDALNDQIRHLPQEERTSRIQSDPEFLKITNNPIDLFNSIYYIAEANRNTEIDFTEDHFSALNKLRIAVLPPSTSDKHDQECVLYKEENGVFTKIQNEQEFGLLLKEIFVDIAQKMRSGTPTIAAIKKMTPDKIAQQFRAFFTPHLSAGGAFNAHYDNLPWSFKLVPNAFDSFWTTVFNIEQLEEVSQTIAFENASRSTEEVFRWAEQTRATVGSGQNLKIPARYPAGEPADFFPGHSLSLRPNHPTMVSATPARRQEMMTQIASLPISKSEQASKEAINWAVNYLKETGVPERSITDLKKRLEKHKKDLPSRPLPNYLNFVKDEVAKLCTPQTVPAHQLELLATRSFQGLFTDMKADETHVIRFGDMNFEYYPSKGAVRSVPYDCCFYPNPLTLQWSTMAIAATKETAFTQPLQFPTLTILTELSTMREPILERQQLVTKRQLHDLQKPFKNTWRMLQRQKNDVAVATKNAILQIMAPPPPLTPPPTLEQIAERLKGLPQSIFVKTLQDLIVQKITQQKAFQEFCKAQRPPADPSTQTMFVQRHADNPPLKAFDVMPHEFLRLLQYTVL